MPNIIIRLNRFCGYNIFAKSVLNSRFRKNKKRFFPGVFYPRREFELLSSRYNNFNLLPVAQNKYQNILSLILYLF